MCSTSSNSETGKHLSLIAHRLPAYNSISFGRDQTCAMLLGLASGNTFMDLQASEGVGALSTLSPEIAATAKQAFYDFGERPIWTERVTYGNGMFMQSSGRSNGLYKYYQSQKTKVRQSLVAGKKDSPSTFQDLSAHSGRKNSQPQGNASITFIHHTYLDNFQALRNPDPQCCRSRFTQCAKESLRPQRILECQSSSIPFFPE